MSVCELCVGTRSWVQVLCKTNQCSQLLTCFPSLFCRNFNMFLQYFTEYLAWIFKKFLLIQSLAHSFTETGTLTICNPELRLSWNSQCSSGWTYFQQSFFLYSWVLGLLSWAATPGEKCCAFYCKSVSHDKISRLSFRCCLSGKNWWIFGA